jgi:hypothetical protein
VLKGKENCLFTDDPLPRPKRPEEPPKIKMLIKVSLGSKKHDRKNLPKLLYPKRPE